MELEISRKAFYEVLGTPKDIIEESQFCVLSAEKDAFTLQTGGGGIYLKAFTPAKVKKTGSFSTELAFIKEIHFPSDKIRLKVEGTNLHFKSGKFSGKISINQPDNITTKPLKEITEFTRIKRADFTRGIDLLNMDTKLETRDTFMKVAIKGKKMEIVSSGDYCAARYRTKAKGDIEFTVNRDLLSRVIKIAEGEKIQIGANEKQVRVIADRVDCYFPASQKNVANIEKFIKNTESSKSVASFVTNAAETKNSIKAASSIVSARGIEDVRVMAEIEKGKVIVKTSGSFGDSTNEFPIKHEKFKRKVEWKWSSNVLLNFLTLLGKENIKVTVYENFMILMGKELDVLYVIPQVK